MIERSLNETKERSENEYFPLMSWESSNKQDYVSWEINRVAMGTGNDKMDQKNIQDMRDPRSGYVVKCYTANNRIGEFGVLRVPDSVIVKNWLDKNGINISNYNDFKTFMEERYEVSTL